MAGIKVHELAKEFGMSSKELMVHLGELNIPAKSHATSLVDAYVDILREKLGPIVAERQAEIAAERMVHEAELAAKAAAEEAARKVEDEARRLAEEEERKHREADRKAREEERLRVEHEARERLAAEAAASEPAHIPTPVSVPVPAPAPEPAPAEAVEKAAPAPVAEPAKDIEAQSAAKSATHSLESAIASEAARLGAEESAKVEKDEEDRYRNMAVEAEKLQRDKVLAEMRAEVEAAKTSTDSKKKKKNKKNKNVDTNEDERIHIEATKVDLPHGGDAVSVPEGATVSEFAELLEVPTNDIIKTLFLLGSPLTLNQSMTNELIELIADDLERPVSIVKPEEEAGWTFEDSADDLLPRSPVVTVMGHVDHGKTSLLDAIRETGVAATEAGGITQHIGASVVEKNGRRITFIDTPGHEAFTAMRARGANITDIVILVVAADDGVMPQTIEAISHAKAAGVPIVVAVNKIDKDGANPDQVRQMLTEYEVVPEEWGGSNIFVNVSAKKRLGIDELLEMLLIQADMLELTANPNAPGFGTVIEAKLDKGRGPLATVLVQRGTLRVGDALVAGTAFGRIRALLDPKGKHVKTAGPSEPVEILGLGSVPSAGDEFCVFTDERKGRALADDRAMKLRLRQQAATKRHVSLDDLFAQIEAGEIRDLNLIVKADVQGSIEALRDALEKMDQTEVRLNIIHAAVGGITETDVQLATASDAIIIGFNVRPNPGAKALAEEEKVDMRMYRVIYQAIEEINAARVGMLAPDFVEEDTARIEVRDLFRVPKMGVIAGSYVLEGEIHRDDKIRIVRDGTVIFEGRIGSLRRFKDDVKTVKFGFECGVGIEGYQDLKEGDIIEGYRINEIAREE